MQLPIGYDDFGDLIEKKLDFVDKTYLSKKYWIISALR